MTARDPAALHVRTPLIPSTPLGRIVGRPVYLKLENTQPTASFKLRGIARLCANAAAAGATSIVSSSGGNAGLAAAYAARKLGLRAQVVIPRPTPAGMVALIEAEGADVIIHGESWVDADQRARAIVDSEGATYVSPFDHPDIWAGHSTLVDGSPTRSIRPAPSCSARVAAAFSPACSRDWRGRAGPTRSFSAPRPPAPPRCQQP
jgi:L-serine/L-threonine ammonia-lyase